MTLLIEGGMRGFVILACLLSCVIVGGRFFYLKKTVFSCKPLVVSASFNDKQLIQCLRFTGAADFFLLHALLKRQEKEKNFLAALKITRKLAWISFYDLKNYELALQYYTRLLTKYRLNPAEQFLFKLRTAESFFYLGKFKQAELEIQGLKPVNMSQEKKLLFLHSRIVLALQDLDRALELFYLQIKKYPQEESFFKEYISLVYEMKRDFISAAKALQDSDSSHPFIKRRIQSLLGFKGQSSFMESL